jgi:hypothetical protein
MNVPTLSKIVVLLFISSASFSQEITCNLFTVTGLTPDEFDVNSTLINIQMGGGVSDFANYPFIASVTDCNGDTAATGGMFFFGQIGGTEQGYPVSLIADDVCLPLSIEFIYGNDLFENDTCLFSFGEEELGLHASPRLELSVFPNPFTDIIQITSGALIAAESYTLLDAVGLTIQSGIIHSNSDRMDLSHLADGLYFLGVKGKTIRIVKY